MSQFYNPQRSRNLYDENKREPYRLSRSKIELFMKCPRCFYLDRRLGVGQPPGPPFSLNSAVDLLLKKEFDIHRAAGERHPMMAAYGVDAVPFAHEKMDEWRDALGGGITYLHEPTNLLITGGVDDVWVNPQGELIIVDYKATAKSSEVNIDAEWQIAYKRQMELYQWLFRRNGFAVSPIGYFVYVNGKIDRRAFDGKLEFDVKLIPYEGRDMWIEGVIEKIHTCLAGDELPEAGAECDFCAYRRAAHALEHGLKKI